MPMATTPLRHFVGGEPGPAAAEAGGPDRDGIVRTALLIRFVEEKLLDLFAEGKLVGTVHTCVGQEFSAAVVGSHLRAGDAVFSNHRCHGHYLAATGDVLGLVGEVMGRAVGVCGGRGGSQHLCRPGFLSTGILAGATPIGAGAALAARLRGADEIAAVFLGDGALGEGVLYEVLNIASLWRLPMLFVVEDNGYAQSTPQRATLAGTIGARAEAFDIPVSRAGCWDWEELWACAETAMRHVRSGRGPCLLHVDTYRLRAHSKGDDDRDPREVAVFERRDPLNRLLESKSARIAEFADEARMAVDEAVRMAERSPVPTPDERAATALTSPTRPVWRPATPVAAKVVDRVHTALAEAMRADPKIVILGEDIAAPYGGAFKVTRDLSERHRHRVRNTPISEAAVVGICTGLALHGRMAFAEIMFGDFVTLVTDQLVNQAAKLGYLRGPKAAAVDVVVRTPMGGRRGYGPTHSQTLDRLLVGTPGLGVVAMNSITDPAESIAAMCRGGNGPTVLVENKVLYGRRVGASVPANFTVELTDERFPMVRVHADRPAEVTLVGYGGMGEPLLAACDELFTRHDVIAQVLCPTRIHPLDWTPFFDLITEGRVVVVAEEGPSFSGFGAELIAQTAEHDAAGSILCRRVGPRDVPIPAARELENDALPQCADIVRTALAALKEAHRS